MALKTRPAVLGLCVAVLTSAPGLAQEKVWRHG